MRSKEETASSVSAGLYDFEKNDPGEFLIDRSTVSSAELREINEVMHALGKLRNAEQLLSEASQRYMKLGRSDMRALHFLIVASHTGTLVTPSAISAHLSISSASTTKLLDRLEASEHIVRAPHPKDRRALVITVTEETREAAMQTVGRLQAKRFRAASRLTSEQRAIVVGFLNDMSDQIALRNEAWAAEEPGEGAAFGAWRTP